MSSDMRFNTTEYLVDRFLDELIRFALIYVRNKDDAQDVVQQVFLTYLQRKPVFVNEDHAKRWLMKVTVNTAKNFKRGRENSNVSFDEIEGGVASGHTFGRTDEEQAVYEAVMSLKRSYREIVHLYYYEDMTSAQIASILGITEGGVRARLARARTALEQILKGGAADEK